MEWIIDVASWFFDWIGSDRVFYELLFFDWLGLYSMLGGSIVTGGRNG